MSGGSRKKNILGCQGDEEQGVMTLAMTIKQARSWEKGGGDLASTILLNIL